MERCWERRGCDEEMWSRCPHNGDAKGIYSPCPADCYYANCTRATHEVASDIGILLDPTVDRTVAKKECCTFCTFFLTHGPRLSQGETVHFPSQNEQMLVADIKGSAASAGDGDKGNVTGADGDTAGDSDAAMDL